VKSKKVREILRDYTPGIRLFSIFNLMTKSQIDPNWISGFVDGEGTFYVGINKHEEMSAGWQVLPEFRVVQHQKDIKLLYKIKEYLGCGTVRKNHGDRYELRIRKLDHLKNIVIPFFESYPLQTQKKYDFLSFRKVVLLIDKKEHLTEKGIKKIFSAVKKMNRANKNITKSNIEKDDRIKI